MNHNDAFSLFIKNGNLLRQYQSVVSERLRLEKECMSLLSRIEFRLLDGREQFSYFSIILDCSEDLYSEDDPQNDYCQGIYRPMAEKRVRSVITMCENRAQLPVMNLNEQEFYTILGRAYRMMGMFFSYKSRFDFLETAIEYIEKAEHIFRVNLRDDMSYYIARVDRANMDVEYCFQYEIMGMGKDPNAPKLSRGEIDARKRNGEQLLLSQMNTFREIQEKKRHHAEKAERTLLALVEKQKNEEVVFDRRLVPRIYLLLARTYFHKENWKLSMGWSTKGIKMIYEDFGASQQSFLGELYEIKERVYQKMGRCDLALKMMKLYDRLQCSGMLELRDSQTPIRRVEELTGENPVDMTRRFLKNQAAEERRKGRGKLPEWAKIPKYSGKCFRKCSNVQCMVREDDPNCSFKLCSRCKCAYYCSKRCQKKDWIHGHKSSCKAPKK